MIAHHGEELEAYLGQYYRAAEPLRIRAAVGHIRLTVRLERAKRDHAGLPRSASPEEERSTAGG